jgi:predicted HAD superfamily hydrolase
MSLKTFYSLSKLIHHAEGLLPRIDVLTVDLFDTLLIRRVHDPDLIKRPVARFIAQKAADRGLFWHWKRVQALRDEYEQQQRADTGAKFEDHEANYPDYMSRVLQTIFGDADLLGQVTAYELEVEQSMIVPRRLLAEWLQKAHQKGIQVIVVSDIYLPAEYLKQLIERAGLTGFIDDVVSSADTSLAKASGRAFTMLEQTRQLDRSQWLHIGDNPISDGLRPSAFGVTALVLMDIEEKNRRALARSYALCAKVRPFWRGRLLQQVMLPIEAENVDRSPLYNDGYTFFGPLVGVLIQRLLERTIELGIRRIFFFSREGWLFKKCWEKAAPRMACGRSIPNVSYLYVSRLALAGATCAYQGLTETNAVIAFLPSGNRDIRDLCRVYQLNIEPFIPIMKRFNLEIDTPLSPLHQGFTSEIHKAFYRLLRDPDFQEEVKRQTRPHNDAVQAYLESEGLFEQSDVAVVDVGWLGTIQRFLFESIQHRDDKPNFHGFLFAASRGIDYPTCPENYIEGVLYDKDRFDFAGSTIMYARDVFEECFRAPHPTLDGYRLDDGKVKLVFRSTADAKAQMEVAQGKYFAPLQQGIFDAVLQYAAAANLLGYTVKDLKPWANYLMVNKLAFAKTVEIERLRNQTHLDDFSGKHVPLAKVTRKERHLWDHSLWALKWLPGLRLAYYLRSAVSRLRH